MGMMKTVTVNLCIVVGIAGIGASVRAAEDEKLLFGFEREEAEKAAEPKKKKGTKAFEALENGDFLFFHLGGGTFHTREMASIRPLRCVKEMASQGSYSCKVIEKHDKNSTKYPCFRLPRPPVLGLQEGAAAANLRRAELLNTSGWFAKAMPRDWSGYDLLRVDVFLKNALLPGL